ncbi:hypothetical protein [Leptolyngbya sp. PL-A3]|uniref:hypothetical protein n=1 Tax=Leptolyngbya sp. PL-A3 TaxID=2933911 RepID=UPI003296BA70
MIGLLGAALAFTFAHQCPHSPNSPIPDWDAPNSLGESDRPVSQAEAIAPCPLHANREEQILCYETQTPIKPLHSN